MSDAGGDYGSDGGDADDYGSYGDEEVDVVEEGNEEEKEHEGDDTGGVRRGTRKVPENERITTKFITKYERARILGSRAL